MCVCDTWDYHQEEEEEETENQKFGVYNCKKMAIKMTTNESWRDVCLPSEDVTNDGTFFLFQLNNPNCPKVFFRWSML